MKKLLLILGLSLGLAGCNYDPAKVRRDQIMSYKKTCSIDYGFRADTKEYKQCVQKLDMAAKKQSQQAWQNVGNSLGNMGNSMRPTYVNPVILPAPMSSANNWGTGWD